MSERTDHAAEAREWVAAAERPTLSPSETAMFAGIAQVHATLALVEQQRIANLIALGQARVASDDLAPFRSLVFEPLDEHSVVPAEDVREGLGL